MEIQGSITQIKWRINAAGDSINTLTIEVHGDDVPKLHEYLKKPIEITIQEAK